MVFLSKFSLSESYIGFVHRFSLQVIPNSRWHLKSGGLSAQIPAETWRCSPSETHWLSSPASYTGNTLRTPTPTSWEFNVEIGLSLFKTASSVLVWHRNSQSQRVVENRQSLLLGWWLSMRIFSYHTRYFLIIPYNHFYSISSPFPWYILQLLKIIMKLKRGRRNPIEERYVK